MQERLSSIWKLSFPGTVHARAESVANRGYPQYGFMPALARRHLGRLQSESYCERVISFLGKVANDRTVAANH